MSLSKLAKAEQEAFEHERGWWLLQAGSLGKLGVSSVPELRGGLRC